MEGNVDTKRRRLAGIEGVRAIAAMSVLVYHVYFYAAPDGRPVDLGPFTKIADNLRAGVTLFFVLSGFLLYRVFVAAALRSRPMPSVRQYLRNRALRILPAYWVILIGVALVFQHELLTQPLMLLANMLLLQNYFPSYLVGGEEGLGIVPAWSLVIEVSFYLLVPILGYVAIRLAARRGLAVTAALVPVGAMLALGIAAKVISRGMEPSDALAIWNHALPTHADWFAAGMALAVARVLHEDGRLHLPRALVVVGTVGAALFAVASAKLYLRGHYQRARAADRQRDPVRSGARLHRALTPAESGSLAFVASRCVHRPGVVQPVSRARPDRPRLPRVGPDCRWYGWLLCEPRGHCGAFSRPRELELLVRRAARARA